MSVIGALGTREDSAISAFRTLRTRDHSVTSAFGALDTRGDSAISASVTLGTREKTVILATGTLGIRNDPVGLAAGSLWTPEDSVVSAPVTLGTLGPVVLEKVFDPQSSSSPPLCTVVTAAAATAADVLGRGSSLAPAADDDRPSHQQLHSCVVSAACGFGVPLSAGMFWYLYSYLILTA